jgi:hypothetical protein
VKPRKSKVCGGAGSSSCRFCPGERDGRTKRIRRVLSGCKVRPNRPNRFGSTSITLRASSSRSQTTTESASASTPPPSPTAPVKLTPRSRVAKLYTPSQKALVLRRRSEARRDRGSEEARYQPLLSGRLQLAIDERHGVERSRCSPASIVRARRLPRLGILGFFELVEQGSCRLGRFGFGIPGAHA